MAPRGGCVHGKTSSSRKDGYARRNMIIVETERKRKKKNKQGRPQAGRYSADYLNNTAYRWILSPIMYLSIVALWLKSKKRNREGKQPREFEQSICINEEFAFRNSGLAAFTLFRVLDSTIEKRKIARASCSVIVNADFKPVSKRSNFAPH